LRALDGRAHIFDARHHGRERDELCTAALRDQARERRFTGAGRSPKNERVRITRFDGTTQWLTDAEQMRLTDDFV
jgi:hypothetical protein